MPVRSQEQLRRDQAELLEAYRAEQRRSGASPTADTAGARGYHIGRITSVVTSDETHGAHLVVKPQAFSGRPTAASNSSIPGQIAYPTPNLSVVDYAVDEYVALWTAKGAALAVKLGAERYWGELHTPTGRSAGWDQYVTI